MGHYHSAILKFLEDKRYKVYCYNPILVKNYSKVGTFRKTKTDKMDALVVAKVLMVDLETREVSKDKLIKNSKS